MTEAPIIWLLARRYRPHPAGLVRCELLIYPKAARGERND